MTMEKPISGPVGLHKYTVMAGWGDVPHLDEATKAALYETCEPHLRDARTRGIPSMGAGAVYPVTMDEIGYDPFPIPSHWKRMYAMDVGWRRTAALWFAQDPETSVKYVYAEHYRGRALPIVHADAIKSRGVWIPGVIDPASRTSSQADGKKLLYLYQNAGLILTPAVNAVEAGLYEVWTEMQTGQLKISRALANFWAELRMYRRELDENQKGKIVKINDHLMDCLRYGTVMFDAVAIPRPVIGGPSTAWEPADKTAGY
jgi:hypothetical protein